MNTERNLNLSHFGLEKATNIELKSFEDVGQFLVMRQQYFNLQKIPFGRCEADRKANGMGSFFACADWG